MSWGRNGFFVLASANQLLRNPDKKKFWPTDILAKLENPKKLQINYMTEFYSKHNYSSESMVSSAYGFLTVPTAFFAWLKILPRRIKSIKLKSQMIVVPEMTHKKLGPTWMNGNSVGYVLSTSALKWFDINHITYKLYKSYYYMIKYFFGVWYSGVTH